MRQIGPLAVGLIAGLIGLAIIAVIVSKRSQTPQMIALGGSTLAGIVRTAVEAT